jgi:hypothetical protein
MRPAEYETSLLTRSIGSMGLEVHATGLENSCAATSSTRDGTGTMRLQKDRRLDFPAGRTPLEVTPLGIEMDTPIASAHRRTKPARAGLVELSIKRQQMQCQFFSVTVTNPGLIPVDTNANLRC